jgi:hypothetical protein
MRNAAARMFDMGEFRYGRVTRISFDHSHAAQIDGYRALSAA